MPIDSLGHRTPNTPVYAGGGVMAFARNRPIPPPTTDDRSWRTARVLAIAYAWRGHPFKDVMRYLARYEYRWSPVVDRLMVAHLVRRHAPVIYETRSEALEASRQGIPNVHYALSGADR